MSTSLRICDECGIEVTGLRVRGRCDPCYRRLLKGQKAEGVYTPLPSATSRPKPVAERFWRYVQKTETCWTWTGERARHGYGVLNIGERRVFAHRISYEMHIGSIPDGLIIDHLCRNTSCVNPDHLEAVTNRVNVLRGVGPSAKNAVKTHCLNGHEFTPTNTLRQPPNWLEGPDRRGCRECKRKRNRDAAQARRAKARKEANA